MSDSEGSFDAAEADRLGIRVADCGCCYLIDTVALHEIMRSKDELTAAAEAAVQIALDKGVQIAKVGEATKRIIENADYIQTHGFMQYPKEVVQDMTDCMRWAAMVVRRAYEHLEPESE